MLEKLREKMLSVGYLQNQIDGITIDIIGHTALSDLGDREIHELSETYNRCINFVVRSLKDINKSGNPVML